MERGKVVMGYHDKGPLIEASLHRMIEFLTKDTRAVECVSTAVRGIWRAELDVR